jgi:hypothetical protein
MSNPHKDPDHIAHRIDACIFGRIEKATGPDRLTLCRSISLYTQISPALYSPEMIAAMLKKASVRRFGGGPSYAILKPSRFNRYM